MGKVTYFYFKFINLKEGVMSRHFCLIGKKRKTRQLGTIALALFAIIMCLLASECKRREPETIGAPTGALPDKFKKNRPPHLEPLFGEIRGQRVPVIRPGMTVVVKAHATDPDGDFIRYRWIVAPGSGTIDSQTNPSVKWHVGKGKGLLLFAYDGKGGWARSSLKIPKEDRVVFSGHVVSNFGKPIETAEVEVGDETAKTDEKGYFELLAKRAEKDRYVLNIRKQGFGLVSRIYDRGIQNGRWTMTKGTTEVLDPTQDIKVQDTTSRTGCLGPLSNRIDWSLYSVQRIPLIFDTTGQPLTGDPPPELREAMQILAAGTECNPGISISIPPNSLVDESGNPPTGKVEVTLSTVDLYAPDSMPGDYSVESEAEAMYMQSFGAGTVSITAGGRPCQLKQNAKAMLTIPVDPTQLKVEAPLPPTIPFLSYDEKKGLWILEGTAKLNSTGDAYTAEVSHFSAFNTDLVKTNQSCVRIDSSAIPEPYTLEVTIPMGGSTAPVVRNFTISPDLSHPENPNIHAIYNLPSNTWIVLVAIKENPPGTFVPLGTFVVNTGDPQIPSRPNRPLYDYIACQSQVALEEVTPKIQYEVDCSGRNFGPLPAHIYALAAQSDETDIYPLGDDGYFLFCLFDTGSTKVRIFNELPYYFVSYPLLDPNGGLICHAPNRLTDGNYFDSDASILGLTGPETVRLRLNGYNKIDPATLKAPCGAPGSANPAQIELTGIEVYPQPTPPSPPYLNVTLIGVPVIHQIVTKIDYTTKIERTGFNFYPDLDPGNSGIDGFQRIDTASGPDINFYHPKAEIPFPDLFIRLDRWGMPERYCLKNVTFKNDSGEVNDQNLPPNMVFQYDTATTITIINDYMANMLGLTGPGTFDCFEPNDRKGYVIDEVTMAGPNGTYKITNVSVCWDQSRIDASAVVAAVIGSNFFDQVPILFDGPRNRLGIGPPTTTPVTWTVLPRNCD